MRYDRSMIRILVTGGAGFIGSFLVDELIRRGYAVRILDSLDRQVHGRQKPTYLNRTAQFFQGDVRSLAAWRRAVRGADIVFHLASKVGVAQSNYQVREYCDVNIGGTARLLHLVANEGYRPKKIILTSSMTSYGEGNYRCDHCGIVKPPLRDAVAHGVATWDPPCPRCGGALAAVATGEDAPLANNSIYALTKRTQEEMLLLFGKLYGVPVVSLRCFNVYGPRQSLSNPYTGVAAIFLSRLKNNQPPIVYEDGLQSRDFVSVHDVVDALIKAMGEDGANGEVFNIGSGTPTTILHLARTLATLVGNQKKPIINGQFRKNDIRHCFADTTKARRILRWRPRVALRHGLSELLAWSQGERAIDRFEQAQDELRDKALV